MAKSQRVYLQLSGGFRLVRGGPVLDLQRALGLEQDGVFGGDCEKAVKAWQAGRNLPQTGHVDGECWQAITGTKPPSLFRRCMALTAAFEGHGYTLAVGNFDGAWLTWGVIGFTLKHGNLGRVVTRLDRRHPGLIAAAIGPDMARTLLRIVAAPDAERQAWADSISIPPGKHRLDPAWAQAFERLGRLKETQAMQEDVAREVYWARAVKDLKAWGRMTEADAALFFDTAVQNGGINAAKRTRIQTVLAKNPSASGRARLRLLADAIADGSGARYREDVRTRRRAIADGEGLVHGAKYRLAHWALDLSPVAEADLA